MFRTVIDSGTAAEDRTSAAEPTTNGHGKASHTPLISALNELWSEAAGIVRDVRDLGAVRVEMMRAEMRAGAKAYQRSVIMLASAAALAALGIGALTIAAACGIAALLPYSPLAAFACGTLIVALLYCAAAWFISQVALKRMKAASVAPRASMHELKKDFDIISALRMK
jgi:hypothetical protein